MFYSQNKKIHFIYNFSISISRYAYKFYYKKDEQAIFFQNTDNSSQFFYFVLKYKKIITSL